MSKIKSTIDLIMEKTRHLSLTTEEKESLAQQELEQRVQGPLVRYLKEEGDVEFLAKELERFPPQAIEKARALCLALLMDRLHPFRDNSRILAAVERLCGKAERTRWQQAVAPLQTRYRQDLQRTREEAAGRRREILASAGLAGPALIPSTGPEDPASQEAQEAGIQAFREGVKSALGNHQM